ncbi:unnamed protein product [Tilletia controversa]|uniref:AB hydrolase-1 domain-containing protein n=1 Tax=Tilletia controversa TaxID=13291 RepID=A0A8X7MY49_9BASI|nr:hypothetical protein CF328_g816 [Tilletia controversa]KAE8254107.1 hypothetical protein A4X06_0g1059 [Tilletia controversa]CAD6950937.1 unnamed protein product [Tilletia controversa]CAD6976849.1 unnamed protein product [Tilletia controversa]
MRATQRALLALPTRLPFAHPHPHHLAPPACRAYSQHAPTPPLRKPSERISPSPTRTRTRTRTRTSIARSLSTAADSASSAPAGPTGQTVDLKYDLHQPRSSPPAKEGEGRPGAVVIAHGLFGSKQNWGTLGKSIAARTGLPVYALDLRNHGASPHVDSLHYKDMAADIVHFIQDKVQPETRGKPVVLIGHSMGGKATLAVALSPDLPKDLLTGIISVDMSPQRGALSKEFMGYVDAMEEIERAQCSSRKQADEILQRWEKEISVRQFLLTNLTRNPSDAPFWTFRIPLHIIRRHIAQLGDFPYSPADGSTYGGKTLFVKGSKSAYINRKNIPLAREFFPRMRLLTLEAGHWVQAEKPREFVDLVEKFVSGEEEVGKRPAEEV